MKPEIKFGLILGLGICAYTTLAHLFGFYTNNIQAGKYGDVVIILLPIAVLFLAIREKRMRNGSLTVFEGIKTGLLVALVSFPISAAFLRIYHHYINPGWLEFILTYEKEAMMQAGAGAAEMATRIDQMRAGNSGFAQLVGGFIGTMALSLILSLIFSLILRRKRAAARLMKSVIGMLLLVNLLSVFIYAQSGKNLSPQISITIDDIDLNSNDTPKLTLDQRNLAILDALRQHGNLKAALFVCGMRVDNEQGRKHLLEWDKAKHIISNHSYSHFYYPSVEFDKFSQDILRGENVISNLKHFRKLFRFPYLKEGNTLEKRDKIRSFLKENDYRMGYVTIDTSEWAIDARLRKRLNKEPNADLTSYRNFYLEHIWERAVFYDDLAKKVTGKPVKHTLLIHHNLITALFLGDLLDMFKKKGWKLINAEKALKDPVFNRYPDTVPAGESIIWSLAKESGKFNDLLRYPAEDARYENEKMDKFGL